MQQYLQHIILQVHNSIFHYKHYNLFILRSKHIQKFSCHSKDRVVFSIHWKLCHINSVLYDNYLKKTIINTHTHTCLMALFPGLPGWAGHSWYQKGKTKLDFTEARHSKWQWHKLGVCKSAPSSRQITMPAPPPLSFLQAECPSCRPTNSVKALKAKKTIIK